MDRSRSGWACLETRNRDALLDTWCMAVEERRQVFAKDPAYTTWSSMLDTVLRARKPQHILCLGIGTVDSPATLDQWALLEDVRARMVESSGTVPHVTVFDPLFSEADVAFMQRRHAHLPDKNRVRTLCATNFLQCGAYELSVPTFVYMPHCPKELYEALLRANWDKNALERLVLCGNELSMYTLDMAAYPCLDRIHAYVHAHSLPALPASAPGALDASIQVFFKAVDEMPVTQLPSTWTYQPVRRKARARRAKPSAVRRPWHEMDDGFWTIPTSAAPSGAEVLQTPVSCVDDTTQPSV